MVLAVGLSPPFADVAGKKATWKRRSAPNVRYTHQPGWEKSKTKITTSPHFLILHLSLVLCRWICKTIRLWAIMWTENDTLLWHVSPLARSFSDVLFDAFVMYLWCVIWCTSNVYFPIPWWGHLAIPEGAPGRQGRGRGFDVSQSLEKSKQDAN